MVPARRLRGWGTMSDHPTERAVALVVEDDEHIGHLLQFILQRAGYDVALQRDGHAAQAYIERQPAPAVVLLDLMLPFVDGFELLGLLRARPGWAQVPVLVLTARSRENDVARVLAAGASDCIPKPFQPDELLARLRRLEAPQGTRDDRDPLSHP